MVADTLLLPGAKGPVVEDAGNLAVTESNKKLDFDPEALKVKYLQEREKRIRANPNGVDQYRAVEGSLSHYLDDPWAGGIGEREPLEFTTEVVIIGAGYGGELMAHQLKENGIEDFKIIDKGADCGGVW
jgi:cyclohexanone monooxygenase